jgi:hypothetical protein
MASMSSSLLSVVNAASVTPISHQKRQQPLEHRPVVQPIQLNRLLKGEYHDVHRETTTIS